jgi:dihydrolipoamide dehydrogenase
MRKRALSVSKISSKGVEFLLKKSGIDVITGRGKITNSNTVQVGAEALDTENIVIATGSLPVLLPGVPFGGRVLSSETLLEMESLPGSLIIVGGGYVGVEYAGIFSALGTKVTVVEMMDKILPGMDPEIVSVIQRSLSKDGVDIRTGAKIEKLSEKGVIVNGQEIDAEKILVAVGRIPNYDKHEMEKIGVKYGRGILTDETMRTNAKGVYAIGDAVGKGMLAHVASREGTVAAENIVGMKKAMDYSCIPSCVFSFPEAAVVGSLDPSLKVGKFPFVASGKARAMGETEGLVKVFVRDGVLSGVAIVGPHATDLIGEACLAVKNRMRIEDITDTVHPHPVLSEAFVDACLDAMGAALSK